MSQYKGNNNENNHNDVQTCNIIRQFLIIEKNKFLSNAFISFTILLTKLVTVVSKTNKQNIKIKTYKITPKMGYVIRRLSRLIILSIEKQMLTEPK